MMNGMNMNMNMNGTHSNLTGDPDAITEVQGMRKNLVRLYTKTDWDQSELNALKDDMLQHMKQLNKDRINQMTYNPHVMSTAANQPMNHYDSPVSQLEACQAEVKKYRQLYSESEEKLAQLQQEYSSALLSHEEVFYTLYFIFYIV